MTKINGTKVDGVVTIWADIPGPLRAGLFFRTGRVDETLATAGYTHLIEHLTLSTIEVQSQEINGFVTGNITGFLTAGNPAEVRNFLEQVCKVIQSLPEERLEKEKQVLTAESASRRYDLQSSLLTWRYGAAGYGLMTFPELGLSGATLKQVQEFGEQKFTKENAVLWLSGPPPATLHLPLPLGVKQPIPPLSPIQWTFPAWFVDDFCPGIAASAVVPRVSASTVFCELVSKRLRESLRVSKAISYAPGVFYDYLNADTAHLILFADSDNERREELSNLFGEVINTLNKIDESEIITIRQQVYDRWVGSMAPPPTDRLMMDIQRVAVDWLFDKKYEEWETIAREALSVSLDDISKFWSDAQSTMMFALPGRVPIQPWMGGQIPLSKVPAVQGQKATNLDAPIQKEQLIHSADGVSILWPDGSHITVRYSRMAGALLYEDGCLRLIGSDATVVTIEPTLWRDGSKLCRQIRERIPGHLLLKQSRPINAIPQPRTTSWQRFRARFNQE